jgi:hypothetical protein|tara:strand:- start:6339 stop:6851 length:513 start_codon:yes stop_codon:yes gene_type:complete
MKKNELVNIITEIVRREVKKEVKRIFINESSSMKLSAAIPKIKSNKVVSTKKILQKPKKNYVEYTKNQSLNKVLNETVGGIPQGDGEAPQVEGYEEYPTLTGEVFDSNRVDELAGGGDVQRQRDIAAVQTLKEKGLNVDEVPEDLMNALTKDYTEILQKSEEITKNRRGA